MPLLLSEGVWIALVIALPVAIAVIAVLLTFFITTHKAKAAGKSAESMVKEAKVKAEHIIKNAEIDAKQAAFEAKQKADSEIRDRKSEISALEQKLTLREQSIDARDAALVSKENSLDQKQASLDRQIESYKNRQAELDSKIDDIIRELEKVSGMSTQQAHDEIMSRVESKMAVEIATFMKNAEDEAKEKAQANAIDLLSLACQRYAQDVTTERTVSGPGR